MKTTNKGERVFKKKPSRKKAGGQVEEVEAGGTSYETCKNDGPANQ